MRKALELIILLFLYGGFFVACNVEDNKHTLKKEKTSKLNKKQFTLITPEYSGIDFTNPVVENDTFNTINFIYVYNGGGVSIGDFNNDSLPDIYFTGNMVANRLYLNQGDMVFKDVTDISGVGAEGWSTGTTVVDINADGLLDIYVCRSGNVSSQARVNLLYLNQGVTDGIPVFKEQASEFGLNDPGYSTQAAFFDYDKDGDLDMYLLNHTNEERQPNRVKKLAFDGKGIAADRFYRNDGDKGFTEVSYSIGIRHDGWGLGLAINDLNGDGWEDILVTNDFIADDFLYINNKDGTFSEQGRQLLKHYSHFSMGNDIADYNNDGLVDIFVSDMLPRDNYHRKLMTGPLNYQKMMGMKKYGYHNKVMRNTLHLNNGKSASGLPDFSEIGQLAGIDATDWSWAPLVMDLDNDGYKDLYVTNGMKRFVTNMDYIMNNTTATEHMSMEESDRYIKEQTLKLKPSLTSNVAFRNGRSMVFNEVTDSWGLNHLSLSNGAAFCDLDLDGDLDLVVNNLDTPAYLFRNENPKQNNYIQVALIGSKSNVQALGTNVWLYQRGNVQYHHHSLVRGYQSSMDPVVHFGLGMSSTVDSMVVKWPDGRESILRDIAVNQRLMVSHSESLETALTPKGSNRTKLMMTDVTDRIGNNPIHGDKEFADFQIQPLLPMAQSLYGPKLAVGDINNDGLDDFYQGGTYEVSGKLFIQRPSGNFFSQDLDLEESTHEDSGSAFFDANGDGALDLYVASGGGEFSPNSPYYQDRLYMNKGGGQLKLASDRLPVMHTSSSCVRPSDYDSDGDMDLFVGGRLSPLSYPMPGTSYLLRNEAGVFTVATSQAAPELANIGMVTDAVWSDYDVDGDPDLLLVGEFMNMEVFINHGGNFTRAPVSGNIGTGWFNCITTADFDGDNDPDYILGNLGMNSRFKPSLAQPVSVYGADFDNNGRLDPVLTYFVDNKEVTVHQLDQLATQLPVARNIFENYQSYAGIGFRQMFPLQSIQRAYTRRLTMAESVYVENTSDGNFNWSQLPIGAQFAPVQSVQVDNIDGDRHLDALLVGNAYGADPVSGPYNALRGLVLLGNGDGTFQENSYTSTGFQADGDCRDIGILKGPSGDKLYLVSKNRGQLQLFLCDPGI